MVLAPLGPNVFEEATVDSCIFILQKVLNTNNTIDVFVPNKPSLIIDTKSYKIIQNRFEKNKDYIFDYLLQQDKYNLVQRLTTNYPTLEKGFEFGVGINTGYIKSELTSDVLLNSDYHPMVPGTGISKYGSVKATGFIMYNKDFVKTKGKLGRTLPDEKFFIEPKILVVRTRNLSLKTRIIATIDFDQKYNLNRLSNIITSVLTT